MGVIAGRIAEIARRCGDLSPLQEPVRQVLIAGNARRAGAGLDAQGKLYAPLAPSTWRGRTGSGPPLAPHGDQSRVVTDYTVQVTAGIGRLTFAASWPDEPWMEYHHTGTRRMPRRDPYGFQDHELYQIRTMLHEHVMQGNVVAPPIATGGGSAGGAAPTGSRRQPSLVARGRHAIGRAAAALSTAFPWPRRRSAAT